MIINENILVNLNFKVIFMYLILVLIFLFIFIVVLVILFIFYWKLKMIFRINVLDVLMYYMIRYEEFEWEIIYIINEIDINCSLYEVIIDDLDDLELIVCKIIDMYCVINY